MPLNCPAGCLLLVIFTIAAQAYIDPHRDKAASENFSIESKCDLAGENADGLEVRCSQIHSLQEILKYVEKEQLSQVTLLNVLQSNFTSLNLDDLSYLPSLHTLIFNESFTPKWQMPESDSVPDVKVLILNDCWNTYNLFSPVRNASLQFTPRMFDGLQSLEELHLVKCYVSNMTAESFQNVTSLKTLHISKGGMGCEPEMDWVFIWMTKGRIVLDNEIKCFIPKNPKEGGGILIMSMFYSFSGHPFLLIMGHRRETEKNCPKQCTCFVHGYNFHRAGQSRNDPIINIECPNSGLTALPDIPQYSTRLNFINNSITDITPLFTNEMYRNVTTIRLDHNRISHIDGDLFYTYLKDRPLDLYINLSFNNLSTLPVKQMVRLYKENQKADKKKPLLTLADNPWNCSNCAFLPEFQELVYFQYYKRDPGSRHDDVRCAEGDGYPSGQMIIKLSMQTLCAPDPPLLEAIDIVNLVLGIILLLFIANFIYNVYQYRHNSKLPWIVTKMPCC